MRGMDHQQSHMFSYLSPEQRVRKGHPLRAVRAMTDDIFQRMSPCSMQCMPKADARRYHRRSCCARCFSDAVLDPQERLLMEEIDYSMLFRWFVGMNLDEPVWDVTVFTKNRNRLLEGDVAREFLARWSRRRRTRA